MACHEKVLNAAKFIIQTKGGNEFTPNEVIKYLMEQGTIYKKSTIRTHICSRCCVNAPKHHLVRWEYFKRIGPGLYKVIYEENYYSLEEIKTKFKSYKELKESSVTEEEYEMFCSEIRMLPKEIVNRAQSEIKFVLMSANHVALAYYLNLKEGLNKEKEGIIVLTPFIFGAPYKDKNGNVRIINRLYQHYILHEIAHHILGHSPYKDEKDKKEKAAEKQVKKWHTQWTNFIIFKNSEPCERQRP